MIDLIAWMIAVLVAYVVLKFLPLNLNPKGKYLLLISGALVSLLAIYATRTYTFGIGLLMVVLVGFLLAVFTQRKLAHLLVNQQTRLTENFVEESIEQDTTSSFHQSEIADYIESNQLQDGNEELESFIDHSTTEHPEIGEEDGQEMQNHTKEMEDYEGVGNFGFDETRENEDLEGHSVGVEDNRQEIPKIEVDVLEEEKLKDQEDDGWSPEEQLVAYRSLNYQGEEIEHPSLFQENEDLLSMESDESSMLERKKLFDLSDDSTLQLGESETGGSLPSDDLEDATIQSLSADEDLLKTEEVQLSCGGVSHGYQVDRPGEDGETLISLEDSLNHADKEDDEDSLSLAEDEKSFEGFVPDEALRKQLLDLQLEKMRYMESHLPSDEYEDYIKAHLFDDLLDLEYYAISKHLIYFYLKTGKFDILDLFIGELIEMMSTYPLVVAELQYIRNDVLESVE